MLKEFLDFERDPTLLAEFEEVARCYSASCVFADMQYRTGVMHSSIKPALRPRRWGRRSPSSSPRATSSIP
jgi:4-hydroxy-4-methyl-2-oxoglutarate aldolase